MKSLLVYIGIGLFLITSCSSNQELAYQANDQIKESNHKADQNIDLTTHLRKFPGLTVKGQGASAKFSIRGINSFSANTDPLIILDGGPVSSYYDVYNMVHVSNIKKIEVLKNPNDLAIYGVRGANGVIKISTNN